MLVLKFSLPPSVRTVLIDEVHIDMGCRKHQTACIPPHSYLVFTHNIEEHHLELFRQDQPHKTV